MLKKNFFKRNEPEPAAAPETQPSPHNYKCTQQPLQRERHSHPHTITNVHSSSSRDRGTAIPTQLQMYTAAAPERSTAILTQLQMYIAEAFFPQFKYCCQDSYPFTDSSAYSHTCPQIVTLATNQTSCNIKFFFLLPTLHILKIVCNRRKPLPLTKKFWIYPLRTEQI